MIQRVNWKLMKNISKMRKREWGNSDENKDIKMRERES